MHSQNPGRPALLHRYSYGAANTKVHLQLFSISQLDPTNARNAHVMHVQ